MGTLCKSNVIPLACIPTISTRNSPTNGTEPVHATRGSNAATEHGDGDGSARTVNDAPTTDATTRPDSDASSTTVTRTTGDDGTIANATWTTGHDATLSIPIARSTSTLPDIPAEPAESLPKSHLMHRHNYH